MAYAWSYDSWCLLLKTQNSDSQVDSQKKETEWHY